ncbi:hypothetical protein NMY22_g7180 [Coprinellus aureogranulatus]|nr:hypothetical protein NMY22_g7180 [Coprinellus aureogranulatus]
MLQDSHPQYRHHETAPRVLIWDDRVWTLRDPLPCSRLSDFVHKLYQDHPSNKMHFNIVLLAFIYSFLALALGVIAQTHPSNLNASVQIFSTDECCGSWIQWNGLAENKCLRFNANRDGFSIIVRGLWNDDTANPTGFGYGVVYKYADGQLCKAPAFEVRTPRCTKVNVPGGVESFSWVKQTYEIPGFGRGKAHLIQSGRSKLQRRIIPFKPVSEFFGRPSPLPSPDRFYREPIPFQ